MNLITERIRRIAERCYPSDTEWVIDQLQAYCEYLSDFSVDQRKAESYDRICCAVLKIGNGSKDGFAEAIALGRRDYRDVLMNAGFGNSVTVHNEWAKEVLGQNET